MQDKMEKLLNQIGMSKDYLENSSINKIIVYDKNNLWEFIIDNDKVLPIYIYEELCNRIMNTFNAIKDIHIIINTDDDSNNYIDDYFDKLIDILCNESVKYKTFIDRKLSIKDGNYLFDVYNKAELSYMTEKKEYLNTMLNRYGFNGNIIFNLCNDAENDILNMIENDKIVNIPTGSFAPKKESVPEVKVEEKKYFRPKRDTSITPIKDLLYEVDNITINGMIFGMDFFESKSGYKIITLKVTDNTDSIYVKLFTKDNDEYARIKDLLKVGSWYNFYGRVAMDKFANELTFTTRYKDVDKVEGTTDEKIVDNAEIKRVELHAHTMMSQMDGITKVDLGKHTCELVSRCIDMGYRGVAITDHNGCQAFPIAYDIIKSYNKKQEDPNKKFKGLYGTELTVVDDTVNIVVRPDDRMLKDMTYVVFDTETTGFNAGGADQMIEIGAVKIKDGIIIDRFDELIDPGRHIPDKITELTCITDEMVKGKDNEENVTKRFLEWTGDNPMVAHNAKFDASFLTMAYKKYNLGEYTNPLLDTLELSRAIEPTAARHSLSALVKRYDIPWDEESHHRGDYDAEATALIFYKMLEYLSTRKIEKMNQINDLVAKDDIHKFGNLYHVNLLVKNKKGLKNLFKIVSYANTKYLYKTPRILRSVINELREGILVGSSCSNGEIFSLARSKSDDELANLMDFYDYIEIQPLDVYSYLIDTEDFKDYDEIKENVNKIIRVANNKDKIVVATGDVHHLTKKDKLYRQIIINQKVPGGGFHPLNKSSIKDIPSQHFRTTREMLDDFSFLNEDEAKKIVVENTNKIADMVEEFEIIPDTKGIPFSPIFENSKEIIKDISYKKAHEIYGENLPDIVKERLDTELNGIINGGFDAIYLIAQKLVKHSNDDGYYVGSRGSVGSSFAATMLGITEVNPLPAHYVCPNCKKTIFTDENNRMYNLDYASGYDLPDRKCECGAMMNKDGQDMPFATFLGFNADKVPDIDLNFSGDYQAKAHEYTKVLFGEDYVYRAGTIGTVADKTAFGYVKGYYEDKGIPDVKNLEVERLAIGVTGVKRTTGQHPGGIVVVPDYKDIFDFTPYQYPADDPTSAWATTHFNYHDIESCLLKLDILGHDNPTIFKYLEDNTGILMKDIPMDDKKVMSLFTSTTALGVTPEQINCETGALALPEFTKFVIGIVNETKPTTFAELVKISGLSHGTDVWNGNAQDIVKEGIVPFKEVIGCRDDIMVYLMNHGVEPLKSFKIMEFVRKGKASKDPAKWQEFVKDLKDAKIPDWFIESCGKIKYMFPKAHATAYISAAWKIAWFKVYKPIYYYAAWFSIKGLSFDLESMEAGYNKIKQRLEEMQLKKFGLSPKESDTIATLEVALEMTARKFKFSGIDLNKSDAKYFIIGEDNKTLIPPFRAIDGLGDTVATKIIEERQKKPFISIEDLQKRAKLSTTVIEKMRVMGVLKNLPESSQLSLF